MSSSKKMKNLPLHRL